MLKWHAEYQLWSDSFALRLIDKREDGTTAVATNVVMEEREPGSAYIAPLLAMTKQEAQSLFDVLWAEGFRPMDGTGNGGHIEALKYHLEDMRKLVFNK